MRGSTVWQLWPPSLLTLSQYWQELNLNVELPVDNSHEILSCEEAGKLDTFLDTFPARTGQNGTIQNSTRKQITH